MTQKRAPRITAQPTLGPPPALVPQKHGGALRAGGQKGQKGGPGRKPDEFKRRMAQLASRDETLAELEKILSDRSEPQFMKALEFAAERGYGKATQTHEHSGPEGGAVPFTFVYEIVDPRDVTP